MKIPGFFLLLFFLSYKGFTIPQQQSYSFKNITINQGLSQNSVVDMAQDSTGFIWFATQDGLNRYDGRNFVIFPVSFDDITTPDNAQLGRLMAVDNQLWMIKKGGEITRFDLFTHRFSPLSSLGRNGDPLPPASCLYIDKQNGLWIGTLRNGLYYLDPQESVQRYTETSGASIQLQSNRVRCVFGDSKNRIWVLTDDGATSISGETGEDHLSGINTNAITEASDNTLWIGSLGQGIYVKKKDADEFKPFRGFGGREIPAELVVETIHADSQNRIWVGTYGHGLFIVDTESRKITHLMPDRQDPFGISFQDILTIMEDNKGGIWVGTDGGGVSYYNRLFHFFKTFTIYNVKDSISIEQIRAIETDEDGVVWLGTSGQGLTSYDPSQNIFKTFHLTPHKPGISNYDRIVSLQTDKEGDLWVGTQGNGLLIMDRKNGNIKKWFTTEASGQENIPDNTIWSMLPAGDGKMWVATRQAGLLLVDKESGLRQNYTIPSAGGTEPDGVNVQSFLKLDNERLILGFEAKDLQLFDTSSGEFTAITNKAIEKILDRGTDIKSLYYEKRWLWVGTAGKGVLVINIETGKTYVLDDSEWLPNNMIYSILPESEGNVWMSSNRGIFRLSYTLTPEELKINQISSYTVTDGLQSNEFNTGAFHRQEDGTLFFGGISGLTYFHPEEMTYNKDDLKIVLTQAMVGNDPLKEDTLITYKNKLRLSSRQNSLSFNYTGLDFVSPENLHFQYLLEGYDKDWIDAGSRNYTAYTNLPPNDYIFKVKVADKISASAPPTSLQITIAAPFWRQWWFVLLLCMSFVAFIYGLHRYRIYQLLEVEKVKNNISAHLHDDLGARLTNIQILTAISKKRFGHREEENKYLNGIEEEIEASARALDEIVWNIKMKDESLEEILAKMRKYAGEVLENGYEYEMEISGDFGSKKMSMQKRRELFLVFKELLNNIRKHSKASRVHINISIEDEKFLMAVEDNGRGFDPDAETDRNGLRNIKDRVHKWNGSIEISSERDNGTRIVLKIPFDRRFRIKGWIQ